MQPQDDTESTLTESTALAPAAAEKAPTGVELLRSFMVPEGIQLSGPEDVSEEDWLAQKTVEFYNVIYELYAKSAHQNSEWKAECGKSTKGFPQGVKFTWKSVGKFETVLHNVSALRYVELCFLWIQDQIKNENIFPQDSDVPFPNTFRRHLCRIFTLYFRILAITLSNSCLTERVGLNKALQVMKEFLYFGWFWNLLSYEKIKVILYARVRSIFSQYRSDYAVVRI